MEKPLKYFIDASDTNAAGNRWPEWCEHGGRLLLDGEDVTLSVYRVEVFEDGITGTVYGFRKDPDGGGYVVNEAGELVTFVASGRVTVEGIQ